MEGRGPDKAPDAVAPPPRHPRFPLIDGMRAIAVACVVVVHVAAQYRIGDSLDGRLLSHLNLGVTIFFLISGFLLYRPFIAHRTGGPPAPRALDYFRRRALRILPAYWLVLTVVIVAPDLFANADGRVLQQYLLVFSLSPGDWACTDCALGQTWSLVVEVTFYAALPLYVLAADRLARGVPTRSWVQSEVALLTVLSLFSIGLQVIVPDGDLPAVVSGSLISYWPWFAIGMGLAIASVAMSERTDAGEGLIPTGSGGLSWMVAALVYLLVSIALPTGTIIFNSHDRTGAFLALGLVAFLLLLPAITTSVKEGVPARVLSWRPIEWCGLVSYGVFLWHVVVIRLLLNARPELSFATLLVATMALSLLAAAGSYYLLERPILRLKR